MIVILDKCRKKLCDNSRHFCTLPSGGRFHITIKLFAKSENVQDLALTKVSLSSLFKSRGHREKMLERDSERENQRRGGVPLLLMGFIILPLFLGLPFAREIETIDNVRNTLRYITIKCIYTTKDKQITACPF